LALSSKVGGESSAIKVGSGASLVSTGRKEFPLAVVLVSDSLRDNTIVVNQGVVSLTNSIKINSTRWAAQRKLDTRNGGGNVGAENGSTTHVAHSVLVQNIHRRDFLETTVAGENEHGGQHENGHETEHPGELGDHIKVGIDTVANTKERILIKFNIGLGDVHIQFVQKRLLKGKLEVWLLFTTASAVFEPRPNLTDTNIDHRSL